MAGEQQPAFDVAASYNRIAQHYAAAFFDELAHKPFDRNLLDSFAESVRGQGQTCDVGSGPGHVARYLYERGVEVCGVDLSGEMVKIARRLNPQITFIQGNILSLPVSDDAWSGIACFYALIHLRRDDVPRAMAEFRRVLRSGGRLLVAVHGGEGEVHADEWFGEPVSVDATLFATEELAGYARAAGLAVEDVIERPPYDFEHQTRRIYLLAAKPAYDSTTARS